MRKIISFLVALTFFALPVYADEVIRSNRDAGKLIALTFDDGPHSSYTEEILDILKQYNIKATFFVVGENVEAMEEKLLRAAEEGHEIGNHTYTHKFITKISENSLKSEIKKTEDIIEKVTGQKPKLFRPPGGMYNESTLKVLSEMGYSSVLWSQDTKDWTLPQVGKIEGDILKNISDGDIILFHDFNQKNSPTPEALRKLIPELLDMGYSFVTVSELMSISTFSE